MLSPSARPYIEASVPVLREHGLAITQTFYRNLLGEHPDLKNLFNMGNQAQGTQQQSLAAAVFAYAANIDNPAALGPVVTRIVHKHASLGIKPEHYPIVGRHLLGAIKETLGEAANEPLIDAWAEAYGLLAEALIAEEKQLYKTSTVAAGELLPMQVSEIRQESALIRSFYLVPTDGRALLPFLPGQYISVAVNFPDGSRQLRQYSLSDAPAQPYYRISVKHEVNGQSPAGQVSSWLHSNVKVGDTLMVSAPFGDFHPQAESDAPMVLLSAGAGITPMVSVLNHLAQARPEQRVIFAHAARDTVHHALQADLAAARERMPNLQVVTFYESLDGAGDGTQAVQGFMQLAALPDWDKQQINVYLCGPQPFMKAMWASLAQAGVPKERLHREVFGPALLEHLV